MEKIIERETAAMAERGKKGKLTLLPTLGGQTALNTAMDLVRRGTLEKYGVEMIGATARAIERGEDRAIFKQLMINIGLDVPESGTARNLEEGRAVAERIGRFPLIIRPAFTLGGTGGGIAYNRDEFEEMTKRGCDLSPVSEVLVEEFMPGVFGWKAADFMDAGSWFQMGHEPQRIDILTFASGIDFAEAWAQRVEGEFDGVKVWLISHELLIRNKLESGRQKDLHDASVLQRRAPKKPTPRKGRR